MGDDDRNEGTGPGECVEHVWRMTGMTLDLDGTHIDSVCDRCGALLVEGPDELGGRV